MTGNETPEEIRFVLDKDGDKPVFERVDVEASSFDGLKGEYDVIPIHAVPLDREAEQELIDDVLEILDAYEMNSSAGMREVRNAFNGIRRIAK